MSGGTVWEDPPDSGRTRRASEHAELLKDLQAHPGKWAIAGTFEQVPAWRPVNAARAWKLKQCETRVRTVDGISTLYVRWPK
jgi:hypothetical protein